MQMTNAQDSDMIRRDMIASKLTTLSTNHTERTTLLILEPELKELATKQEVWVEEQLASRNLLNHMSQVSIRVFMLKLVLVNTKDKELLPESLRNKKSNKKSRKWKTTKKKLMMKMNSQMATWTLRSETLTIIMT